MLCMLASSLPHDRLEDMQGVGGQNSELLGKVRAGIPVRAYLMAQAVSSYEWESSPCEQSDHA